jgi:hypothetical protein
MVYISIQNIPFASTLIACPEKKHLKKCRGVYCKVIPEKKKKQRTGRDLKEG